MASRPAPCGACWTTTRSGEWRSPGRQRAAAAAADGPKQQARAVQQRCQARLAELGFRELDEYLQDRYVELGWPASCATAASPTR